MSKYNFEIKNLQTQLTNNIAGAEAKAELLESVTRAYKKDGSDFASLTKNFNSPYKVSVTDSYSLSGKYLHIGGVINGKYEAVEVDTHEVVRYSKTEYPADRIIKQVGLEAYVILTPDELIEKCKEQAKQYREQVQRYNSELLTLDENFKKLAEAFAEFEQVAENVGSLTKQAFKKAIYW